MKILSKNSYLLEVCKIWNTFKHTVVCRQGKVRYIILIEHLNFKKTKNYWFGTCQFMKIEQSMRHLMMIHTFFFCWKFILSIQFDGTKYNTNLLLIFVFFKNRLKWNSKSTKHTNWYGISFGALNAWNYKAFDWVSILKDWIKSTQMWIIWQRLCQHFLF